MSSSVVDKDHGWRAFFENVRKIEDARVSVGILADDEKGGMHEVWPDGKSSPLTVAEIAVVQEFGTEDKTIPARPFLVPTFDAKREAIVAACQKLVWMVLRGEVSVEQALSVIGSSLASDVRDAIRSNIPPPNAPSTARRKAMKGKGSALMKRDARNLGEALAQVGTIASVKTLIDTGRMLNAVTYAVDTGKGH